MGGEALGPVKVICLSIGECQGQEEGMDGLEIRGKGVFKGRSHNSRKWGGRCWKIPKIPVKSHKEVQSHKSHKEYLVIVQVISQDSF